MSVEARLDSAINGQLDRITSGPVSDTSMLLGYYLLFPCNVNYTGCPKNAERRIFSTLRANSVIHVIIFYQHYIKHLHAEENETIDQKFGWVQILVYAHFLKYSHFQISLDFCDRWAKNCVGKGLLYNYGVLWQPNMTCLCRQGYWQSAVTPFFGGVGVGGGGGRGDTGIDQLLYKTLSLLQINSCSKLENNDSNLT